jgi:hypothetical protein
MAMSTKRTRLAPVILKSRSLPLRPLHRSCHHTIHM